MKFIKKIGKSFSCGLKVGFLLQIGSIGPLCMLVFQLSLFIPFGRLFIGILGMSLADSIYLILTLISVSFIIKILQKFRKTIELILGIVFIMFGIWVAVASLINDSYNKIFLEQNLFLLFFGLTFANPMSVLLNVGVFSFEINKHNLNMKDANFFGLGFLLTTPIFMSFIALIGKFTGDFLSCNAMKVLNFIMGFVLIYFGVKSLFFKNNVPERG
ncbi:MAG: LysE family transporter [Endomicrobium sp.]|jgi:threonine/homoserine/homoserine lactone efflux protein|nr:LysE family transporter [Endomicrobium sp.]